MIDKSDIITCESYKSLCDYVYKNGDEPRSGLVHVNMEEVPSFLEAIKGRPDKYVVVSSCSDFGLCLQSEQPVWLDIPKWARMGLTPDIGYNGVSIEPRCDLQKCRQEDKYSVKCYAFTAFTFPQIPENITHWFMTNGSVYDPRITNIPFGVKPNAQQDIADIAEETRGYDKTPNIYINWVNYTIDRLEIQEYYKILGRNGFNVVDEPKPYRNYLRDLAMHCTVLSPKGNGIDCYRTLETLYMGSMPILDMSHVAADLADLPLLIVKSMYGLRANELHDLYLRMKAANRPLDKIKLSYWKSRFETKRSEMNNICGGF